MEGVLSQYFQEKSHIERFYNTLFHARKVNKKK